jgi:hypothetical protein
MDKAILKSGNKDFLPAAEIVIRDLGKTLSVAFQGSAMAPGTTVRTRSIQEKDLKACLLPAEIQRPEGTKITWRDYVLSKGWRLDGH